jgi:sugar/nucleoside kinase (ribokinase family)
MKKQLSMVVMGDINLDWNAKGPLSFPFSDLSANGTIVWDQIEELPGGSGLNFARFAQQMGYTPLLLAKIGDDPAGQYIYEWLQQHQLELGVTVGRSLSTGKAFIVRDKNDIRFLFNNTPNANRALSVSDVEQYADIIKSCRVLYVSGYCVMDALAPRTNAALRAIQIARTGGQARVIFDVVPHQFYQIYQFPQFQQLTNNVDILISEVATMCRYLNIGDRREIVTRPIAEEAAMRLSHYFDRFMLRFGPSGCDEQVIWDVRRKKLIWEETRHIDAQDKRGFGDLLALRTLKEIFEIETDS